MQIPTIQKGFEAFEPNSKHSNANSNPSNEIQSIRMQIQTIQNGLEAFECKFKSFERDSKHANANSNHSKRIRSIRIQIRSTRKGIRIQIQTIRKGLEPFECKFKLNFHVVMCTAIYYTLKQSKSAENVLN